MKKKNLNRRSLIKQSALGLFGFASSGALSPLLLGQAAQEQKNFLLFIHLVGGYSASFSDPTAFVDSGFGGVGENNVLNLSNGAAIHNMFRVFPSNVLNMWGTLGMIHGQSAHPAARTIGLMVQQRTSPLHQIAAALAGPSPNKLVLSGDFIPKVDLGGNVSGVTLQRFTDMQAILDSLSSSDNPYAPDRNLAAKALELSQSLSKTRLDANPTALETLTNGFPSSIATLQRPSQAFDSSEMLADYGLSSTLVDKNNFSSKLALAELMFRNSSNVVLLTDRGNWDNHNDPAMRMVFQDMRENLRPALLTFFRRIYGDQDNNIPPDPFFADKNVTTVLCGDFVRRPNNSQHGFGVAASVIGPNVKNGNTANVRRNGLLGNTASDPAAFWATLASLVGTPAPTINQILGQGDSESMDGFQRHLAAIAKST